MSGRFYEIYTEKKRNGKNDFLGMCDFGMCADCYGVS